MSLSDIWAVRYCFHMEEEAINYLDSHLSHVITQWETIIIPVLEMKN